MDLSTASAIFSGISTAFKFADFAIRLAEVGSENEVFVRTIQVVRNDLQEVERLLQVKVVQQKLIGVPAKFSWIRSAITSTKNALHEIGKWVERARVDQEAIGSVKFETRVRWVFNDHKKLANRKTELFICHQQLSNVLSFLVPLEEIPATSEPPTYHDVVRFEDLLSPHSLRQAKSCISISQRRSADEYGTASSMDAEQHRTPEPKTSSPTLARSHVPVVTPLPTYVSTLSPTKTFPGTTQSSFPDRTHLGARSKHNLTKKPFEIKQQAWNYIHGGFQEPSNHIPELEDTHVEMSATNTTGPVSPFELLSGQVTSKRRPSHKVPGLFEAPGDAKMPIELDANSIGSRPPQNSEELINNNEPVLKCQYYENANETSPWEMPSPCTSYIPKQTAIQGHYLTSPPPLPPRPHITNHPVNSAPKAQMCTRLSIMNMLNALEDD